MKLRKIIEQLGLQVRCGSETLDNEVRSGYTSDLLSDVLANSEEGDLWITLQIHPNIVAVASMKGLTGIVLTNGREPQEETVNKANDEGIAVMVSELGAYELSGRLYGMGLCGTKDDAGV